MSKEFWKTQTHALVICSFYHSVKEGDVCIIVNVSKDLVTLKSETYSVNLPFRFRELAPVSSLLKELF